MNHLSQLPTSKLQGWGGGESLEISERTEYWLLSMVGAGDLHMINKILKMPLKINIRICIFCREKVVQFRDYKIIRDHKSS